MAKKRKKKQPEKKKFAYKTELTAIIYILIGVFGFLKTGVVSSFVCAIFAFFFGEIYYVLLVLLILVGLYLLIKGNYPDLWNSHITGIIICLAGVLMLIHGKYVVDCHDFDSAFNMQWGNIKGVFNVLNGTDMSIAFNDIGGGLFGSLLDALAIWAAGIKGTKIIYWILIVAGGALFTGVSIVGIIRKFYENSKDLIKKQHDEDDVKTNKIKINLNNKDDDEEEEDEEEVIEEPSNKKIVTLDEVKLKPNIEINTPKETEISIDTEVKIIDNANYQLPTTSILDKPKITNNNNGDRELLNTNMNKLIEVLKEFGIEGSGVSVTVGPACTQYELSLKAGTKLSKLTSLNKEISLALAKKDVRIQAPIPGRSTVGIEMANDSPTTVYIREIMETLPKDKADKKLLVALGKDINGNTRYCEINKTPHMLVAGSTGSGKSVCINCILASILMRTKPDEVKLMLVDPKKVELSVYNGVPHLLCPVVTDPKKASAALQKIVSEMEHRYDVFEETGVKNIDTYNEYVTKENLKRSDDDKIAKMPFIVVIVDELADLMMVASKEVEDSIMRITQMARAAGIHLIIATQRPSTDVITGVIKANIPSRISFAVSSFVDSRTILDMGGAEKLLGRGDMLFLPQGENVPSRIQGAWITEEETKRIVDFTVNQQKAQYNQLFLNLDNAGAGPVTGASANTEAKDEYDDPLYDEIVEYVIKSGKASASLLQRRFKLGYNRAARVIDLLEERGIIGPMNGSKPREVLVKLDGSDDSDDIEEL